MSRYPKVSVVLNVYNERENIVSCLERILKQDYPQERIEVILVDDDSTDNTISLAEQFGVKIVRSGFRNRERAKSIGIEHAKGELLLLMDADVFLLPDNYITRSVQLLQKYPSAVAVQSIRWHYKRNDYIINRYCNLFGTVDPLVLFLGKRGALMVIEDEWMYKKTVISKGSDYFLVKFTTQNLPTVGAQGYIVRRKELLKTSWKPFFFHLDTAYEMVKKGKDEFIMGKLEVEHRYVGSLLEYYQKMIRNMYLFLKLDRYRTYKYDINPLKLFITLLIMFSVVYPLFQSIKGYIRKPDRAWFLHPLFCITVPILYIFVTVLYKTFRTVLTDHK